MDRQPLKAPTQVVIALTGRCNLSCAYCFYADEMTALSDLPTEVWLEFFRELRDAGVMRVTLSGGEVFARRDFWQLLDGVVASKLRFSILTNGTLITSRLAQRLATYRRRLDYIQVSVDGSSPASHDAIRGKGSFARMMRGVNALRGEKLPWTARVTVNKLNVADLEGTLALLHDTLGLKSFGVNEAFPRGAGQCNHSTLEMTPAERRHSFAVMQAFDKAHPGVARGTQAGPLLIAEHLARVERARATGTFDGAYKTGTLAGCWIMFDKLSVLHDGTFVPCHQLPHIALGKVGTDRVLEVWSESSALAELRRRHTIPLETVPGCQGCEYQPYCTGGCPGIAYALTGEVNAVNLYDCYRAYAGEDPLHEL